MIFKEFSSLKKTISQLNVIKLTTKQLALD